MKKNIILVLVTAIIFTGVGVLAANTITADQVSYDSNTSVKDKLDSLYTAQTTTISSLQSQLNSIDTQTKSVTFTSGTTTQSFNLGFKPDYISCYSNVFSSTSTRYVAIIYDKNFNANKVVRINSQTSAGGVGTDYSDVLRSLSVFYTINDNGFTWNVTDDAAWNGAVMHCTAAK